MQIVFNAKFCPQDYVDKNGVGKYPDAPKRCLNKSCGLLMTMTKNGYYRRYLITSVFAGRIRMRRYKCRKCKHTVSMLPSFCLPRYIYGIEFIVELMRAAVTTSIKKAANKYSVTAESITRKQIAQYLSRLRRNRLLIQYGLNQISPESAVNGPPGDIEWTRKLLTGNGPTLCTEFNTEFHTVVGKSFMSTQNRIA